MKIESKNPGSPLHGAIKSILSLAAAGSLAGVGAAWGQTAPPSAASTATASITQLSKVVVTGSRIPQTAVAIAQPVVQITQQQIKASGFQNVSQLLQNLPSVGPSINSQFNGNATGEETVNLHDLGSKRVLVLVNGQRWIPQLTGDVDLTSVPLAAVDHIEVLLDGASSVYGSDAIAGVINIITVKNFNGAEADAYDGEYDGHPDGGGWDGRNQIYSFTVGTTGQHSSTLLSAGYNQQDPVLDRNRTISKEPVMGYGLQNGFPPTGGLFIVENPTGTSQFPSDSGCSPGASSCVVSYGQPYNQNQDFIYITPHEDYYIYGQGRYDLADNLSFHFMTTYRSRKSERVLFPFPLTLGAGGSQVANGLLIGIAKGAPGNPFGVDLVPYSAGTPQFNKWCELYGSPTCSTQYDSLDLYVGTPVQLGDLAQNITDNTFYLNGGFDGSYNLGENTWNWNSDYVYSHSNNVLVDETDQNVVNLQNALSEGCADLPGCVPMNIFGENITPAARNYVNAVKPETTDVTLRDYNASTDGSFFNNWYAGSWGLALGYEYDETDGSFTPSALSEEGNLSTGIEIPTLGRETTNAEFFELRIPLAKDVFLAKDISIDLAQRYSQFKWSGIGNTIDINTREVVTGPASGSAHSSTPRATFKWSPTQDLLLRGTWSQGFRIPSLSELFEGASDNNTVTVIDPCAVSPTTTPRSELPPGCNGNYHAPAANGTVLNAQGGNVQLQPEKAVNRSIGFVISPSSVPGLNLSADFYKTEVTGIIQAASAQFLVDSCYINQDPASCGDIQTGGTGDSTFVNNIVTLSENNGSQYVEGWDFNFGYEFPATSVGNFGADLSGNFMRADVLCTVSGDCQPAATIAGGVQPKHQFNLAVNWSYGQWSANYNATLIGPAWENCATDEINGEENSAGVKTNSWCSKVIALNPDGSIATGLDHLGTTVYNDVQVSYLVADWNTKFSLGIQNIFDKLPPLGGNGLYQSPYRPPSRFIYGRISVKF